MTRRDVMVLAAVVVLGLLLGTCAVTHSREVEHLGLRLRGIPARTGGRPRPATQTPGELEQLLGEVRFHLEIETESDLPITQEARSSIAADGFAGALQRMRTELATRGPSEAELLRIEEHALRQLVEPEALPRRSTAPDDGRVWRSRSTDFAILLAARPNGIGDVDHPLRPLARAYLASLLTRVSTLRDEYLPIGQPPDPSLRSLSRLDSYSTISQPLAEMVGSDADTLVDVLSAWASLSRLIAEDEPLLTNGRVQRLVCVELCQSLLDRNQDVRGLCDGLAEIAADADRPQLERALAAMALSELANIPIGLGWDLPRDESEAAQSPRFTLTRVWRDVRELGAEEGFAARVELAVSGWDAMSPGPMSFDPPAATRRHFRGARRWLDMHVDPNAFGPQLESVLEIAEGRVAPIAYLSGLAGGTVEPAQVLPRMERDPRLRLPLHHLLVMTNAAGSQVPPLRTATTDREGIIGAWRTALGLDDAPFTLRVARLERRLDGLTLLDEQRELVRAGARGAIRWSQFIPEQKPRVAWTPPGDPHDPRSDARMTEELVVAIGLDEDGAQVRLENLSVAFGHAPVGPRTSFGSIPLGIPQALTPWEDAHGPDSRRAYLVMVTPGTGGDAEWTLGDWRTATAVALEEVAGTVDADRAYHAGRRLCEALALLRPDVDVARLREIGRGGPGFEPGGLQALAFAGEPDLLDYWEAQSVLSARERAELALVTPSGVVRAAMWDLLAYDNSKRPPPLLAEELLEVADAEPDRVPRPVGDVMRSIVKNDPSRGANTLFRAIATVLWATIAMLLGLCFLGRRKPHRARGTAALLLIVSLLVAQVDVFVAGWSRTPAWAGWGLAAIAVWLVGRERAERESWTAAALFVIAQFAHVVLQLGEGAWGATAGIVAALAATAGCVALAPVAAGLLRGLDPAGTTQLPRRPTQPRSWRLGARVVIPAALTGIALIGATRLTLPSIVEAALLYVAVAGCFGGVLLWRLSLARLSDRRPMPLPFLVGLVVPALTLLVTGASSRFTGGERSALNDPLGLGLRVWILCALIYVLVRVFDAARIRSRADAARSPSE